MLKLVDWTYDLMGTVASLTPLYESSLRHTLSSALPTALFAFLKTKLKG